MNKLQEHINNSAKKLVTNMLMEDAREWPPSCMILAYQPMRPFQEMPNEERNDRPPSSTASHK